MSTDPNSTPASTWEARLRDAAAHVEQDLRQVVTFINNEVVPDIRRNSSEALRSAAAELERLARRMEETTRKAPPPPPPAV
jgi:hypothetical protein